MEQFTVRPTGHGGLKLETQPFEPLNMDSITCPHHVAQHWVLLVHVADVLAALLEEGLLDLH